MTRMLAGVCLIAVLGCGSAPSHGMGLIPGHGDLITTVEIDSYRTPGMTAYDLVAHLRPEFLRNRGVTSFSRAGTGTAKVYLNGMAYGEIETLKSMDASIVTHIQYLSASDATTRFGTDQTAGAILVTTK